MQMRSAFNYLTKHKFLPGELPGLGRDDVLWGPTLGFRFRDPYAP